MKSKTYPAWLNLVCFLSLMLFPLGFWMLFINFLSGSALLIAGWISVWVFGNMVRSLGKEKPGTHN